MAWASIRGATRPRPADSQQPGSPLPRTTTADSARPPGGARTSSGGRATSTTSRTDSPRRGGPGLPSAIYGHSLGGLLVADFLLDGRGLPDVAILSSPALGSKVGPALRRASPLLGAILPRIAVDNPWDGAELSRDPSIGAAVDADPLCESRTTFRLARGVFSAMDRVERRLAAQGGFPLPVLLVHGGADLLVPTAATAYAGGYPSVERRVYPDVRHEPHHDPIVGGRIVDDMIGWLRERLAP